MAEQSIEELQAIKVAMYLRLQRSTKLLAQMKMDLEEVTNLHKQNLKDFEEVDKQLALVDGRTKKFAAGERPATVSKEMSQSELLELIAQLESQIKE